MFLRNQFNRRRQGCEVVEIGKVSADCVGQSLWLASGSLIRLIEEGFDFRVSFKHQRVKPAGDRLRVGSNHRSDMFDDLDRFRTQHGFDFDWVNSF
jgi:hypothetical protein